MLSSPQINIAHRILPELDKIVHLHVNTNRKYEEFSKQLFQIAKATSKLSPKIEIVEAETDDHLPHLKIESELYSGLCYAALPLSQEWETFVQAIKSASTGMDVITDTGNIPKMKLETYITPHCPHCPRTVWRVNLMALGSPNLEHWIIDAPTFEQRTREAGVSTAPTLLINGEIRWLGTITTGALKKLIRDTSDEEAWALTLQSHVRHSELKPALKILRAVPSAGLGLMELISGQDMSLRMAALRLIEMVMDEDAAGVGILIEPLCELLSHRDSYIRGDAMYALSIIGDPSVLPQIKKLLDDPDTHVREAAAEIVDEFDNG